MILIADSGATKTEWALVSGKGRRIHSFFSQGYNPNYITGQQIVDDIRACLPEGMAPERVKNIFFYGAGVTELQYPFMEEMLRRVFIKVEKVFIAMDTLASCRALLQRKPGFAAILGTGSNSCYYDGENETLNIDSCGFILGDEGSGAYLGKRLITDYLRRAMPAPVLELVGRELGRSNDEIIDIIYTKPFPNRFCGQYGRLICENLAVPYFHDLAEDAFCQLFEQIISLYPDYQSYTFNCVGSVGWYFQDVLRPVVARYGMQMGTLLRTPMEGLIRFHGGE